MSQVEIFAECVVVSLSLLALAGLVRLLRAYCVDELRESLFTIREELFDFAADGHISFEDPGYRALRTRLNRLIRFADHFTGTRLVVLVIADKIWPAPEDPERVAEAAGSLPEDAPQRLREIQERATRAVSFHLMKVSPLVWLLCLAYVLKGTTVWAVRRIPGVDMLERQAVAVESPAPGGRARMASV